MRFSRASLLIVPLLLIAACGSEKGSLADQMVGTWVTQADVYVILGSDGTHGIGHSPSLAAGTGTVPPEIEYGTWAVEGNTLTFTNDPESEVCAEMAGVYEVEMSEDRDQMDLIFVEDECEVRAEDLSGGLTRTTDGSD